MDETIKSECLKLKSETESYYDAMQYMDEIVSDVQELFPTISEEEIKDKVEKQMREVFEIRY